MSTQRERSRRVVLLRWIFGLLAVIAPIVILFVFTPRGVAPLPEGAQNMPRLAAWIASMLGVAALFVQAGLEFKGRVWGVLIDERNRYSLSRLQMTLWTVLVLGTLYVLFIANMARGEDINRPAGASAVAVAAQPLKIDLDWNLIILMGISAGSFITAPIALSRKSDVQVPAAKIESVGDQVATQQDLKERPTAQGAILTKRTPKDARISDLIRGEEVSNANVVDIPRTQMLVITVVVIVAYGAEIARRIAFEPGAIVAFPKMDDTLLGLILVSHASYIGGKLIPTPREDANADRTQDLGRALHASQRATNLVRDIEVKIAQASTGTRLKSLENTLLLARGAAAQAATLPGRVTAANFKVEELAELEGRIQALTAAASAAAADVLAGDVVSAPAPTKVAEVQRKLRAQGFQVTESGIADAATEQAIQSVLRSLGIARKDLHPREYRYYEELTEIL